MMISLPALLGKALSPCAFDEPEKEVEREAENVLAPSGSTVEIKIQVKFKLRIIIILRSV